MHCRERMDMQKDDQKHGPGWLGFSLTDLAQRLAHVRYRDASFLLNAAQKIIQLLHL